MSSIVLIGMPGAGKSTLGILLAKALNKDFIDTDVAIQVREQKSLQQIIDQYDHQYLRTLEKQVLLSIDVDNHVVATGGSAVYSEAGMCRLKQLAKVIYLDVSLAELEERIDDYETRGIAKDPDQSFEQLFDERSPLYRRYADIPIRCDGKSSQTLVNEIVERLSSCH